MTAMGRMLAFYNYGRKHFNRKGWDKVERPGVENFDLNGKNYLVSGANSGIGKSLTDFLYSRGARVYMVCRSEERAKVAREAIAAAHTSMKLGEKNGESETKQLDENNLRVIIADVSLRADVERCAVELTEKWKETTLDGVVCNAGALLNKRVETKEGVETTFACHFLFGTYLLGKLVMPLLKQSSDPRLVIITSGGMYNSKLEPFADLYSGGTAKSFNGQLAYAKAKRAQVVLGERWAKEFPEVKIVSAHPGWTLTPGVQSVFGSFSQWLLSPLRNEWQGTEGIAWLCGAPGDNIKSGSLYLDAATQPLHLHKSTKGSPQAEEAFFKDLAAFDAKAVKEPGLTSA